MSVVERIVKEKFTSELLKNGVIVTYIHDEVEMDAPDVNDVHKVNTHLSNGSPYAVVIKPGAYSSATVAARNESAKAPVKGNRVAMALIAGNVAHKLIGNFFIKFNKPKTPTQIFSKLENAIKWAAEQLN